jgi:hypothetical protein
MFPIFQPKFKQTMVDEKYRVIEAFSIGNEKYYMFDNQFEVPAGRQLAALAVAEELNMRCDKEYLELHTKAMNKILSNNKKINLKYIMMLNINLEERLRMMPLSEHIYKVASVVFFDQHESVYSHDFEYAEKKIEKWKAAGGTLDFFSRTPLKELLPSLNIAGGDTQTFSQVAKKIDEIHHRHLTDILSEEQ